jgi:hypothetical protein
VVQVLIPLNIILKSLCVALRPLPIMPAMIVYDLTRQVGKERGGAGFVGRIQHGPNCARGERRERLFEAAGRAASNDDLRPFGLTGKAAVEALEDHGLIANKNSVPYDTASPMVTSGLRLGSPSSTSRGFDAEAFRTVGGMILTILKGLRDGDLDSARASAALALQVSAALERRGSTATCPTRRRRRGETN